MDATDYDRRDAWQQSWAFVGFAFLASWTIWSALWAPGVARLRFVPGALLVAGWWGPAIAAALCRGLFRPRRGPEEETLETEPAPPRDYGIATLLAIGCVAVAFAFAVAVGASGWQWTWLPRGWPLELGGPAKYMPLDVYDAISNVSLWIQTALVEIAYWFWLLIAMAGAEIGWRGDFLPKVVRAGYPPWLASLIAGGLFGVWLWPLVWHGALTGFYPGEPLWGMPATIAFGAGWGMLLGWLYFRNLRLGPVVVAVAWIAWTASVLPLVSAPFNVLWHVDPRSVAGSAVAGVAAAVLWRFAPPAEVATVMAVSQP